MASNAPAWLPELARRAATEKAFRELCISNPKEAIAAVSDAATAESANIRFTEKGGQQVIELPQFVGEGAEFNAEDLMQVAGGVGIPAASRTQC